MVSYFRHKLTIAIICILFSPLLTYSATIIESDDVTVSARVINPNDIITPVVTNPPGAVNIFLPKMGTSFKGQAYPNAQVFLLKNGVLVENVVADSEGAFNIILEEAYQSTILYTLYSQDLLGNKSLLINYPLAVYSGFITEVSKIRFAPTISVDKNEVLENEYIGFYGYGTPNQELELFIENNEKKEIYLLSTDTSGVFRITIPLNGYNLGSYKSYIKYSNDSRISKIINFNLVNKKNNNVKSNTGLPGDCNKDNKINLIDFSIMAFWYKKDNPPACVDTNNDNKVDLIDFSILAFYWTN